VTLQEGRPDVSPASIAASTVERILTEYWATHAPDLVPTESLMQQVRRAVTFATARYEAISESTRRGSSDRRQLLVTSVVDGTPAFALEDIEQELGYRFSGTHLALLLQATERSRVDQLVATLAERVGAAGSLLVMHGPDTWVLWLRFTGPVDAETRDALVLGLREPQVTVTAGEPAAGLAGFRRTRGNVLAAAALRRRFDGFAHFLWFRDVSLELCLLADEDAARRFMADELGDLNASGDREERARQTLLAWLSCGSSSVVAAQSFLHENTVRMRVSQAQELLPGTLCGRRAEVLAALRLRALLGDPA
jgi:DNA-binding PucR family transcriptional regulator